MYRLGKKGIKRGLKKSPMPAPTTHHNIARPTLFSSSRQSVNNNDGATSVTEQLFANHPFQPHNTNKSKP
jgi:hypothetical protein